MPHVEPSTATSVQQRDSARAGDDAEQTVRHRTWHSNKFQLLCFPAPFRSISGTRAIVCRLEKCMGRQSDQHRGVSTFETSQVL